VKVGEFRKALLRRVDSSGITVPLDMVELLEAYFSLLVKWNARINLTSLPLKPPTDEAVDRLFIEPLMAARHFPQSRVTWFDLGSGGGSPAVPLKLIRPEAQLVMVESRSRKAAFLKAVVRELGLSGVLVENARFKEFAARMPRRADVVSARAVRADRDFAAAARTLVQPQGLLMLFKPRGELVDIEGFRAERVDSLTETAELALYVRPSP
jgi:16S rRNA (guanine527-N7)-methyltransferase